MARSATLEKEEPFTVLFRAWLCTSLEIVMNGDSQFRSCLKDKRKSDEASGMNLNKVGKLNWKWGQHVGLKGRILTDLS
jgi:hypothetical protein